MTIDHRVCTTRSRNRGLSPRPALIAPAWDLHTNDTAFGANVPISTPHESPIFGHFAPRKSSVLWPIHSRLHLLGPSNLAGRREKVSAHGYNHCQVKALPFPTSQTPTQRRSHTISQRHDSPIRNLNVGFSSRSPARLSPLPDGDSPKTATVTGCSLMHLRFVCHGLFIRIHFLPPSLAFGFGSRGQHLL